MLIAERLQERMKRERISQSELARRIGVTQPTIYRMVHGQVYGSSHLHKIARELGTTPAYLTGETDDPQEDAPAPAELDAESRELVERFTTLTPADRRALLQVARSMADGPSAHGTVQAPSSTFKAMGSG